MSIRHTAHILILAALLATGASAQTPAAQPRTVTPTIPEPHFIESAALDGLGNVTLLFEHDRTGRPFLRRYSAADLPLGPALQLTRCCTDPRAAANERGDTVVTWTQTVGFGGQVVVRRLSPGLPPLTVQAKLPRGFSHFMPDVDVDREGRFVAVWMEADGNSTRLNGQRFNADGSRLGAVFSVASPGISLEPRVAMNRLTGDFVIIWQALDPADFRVPKIYGQRFAFASGQPQGRRFEVNLTDLGELPDADVGRADDGSFVVIWTRNPFGRPQGDATVGDLFVRRFGADGAPRGDETLVAADILMIGHHSRLAVAPEGHFVVAWNFGTAHGINLRLFRRDGFPAAAEALSLPGVAPELAFGSNGTFVLAWGLGTVAYRRFAAAPGQEVCLFGGGHFRCDTDRTGGAPEIDHLFSIRGGTPLLGDVDGDRRDDYCLVRGTRFDCDTGHDYGAAEFTVVFGQPGDTPLLGDLDVDGREDACVFRAGHFLCDTGRNGGTAELDIAFGQPGDLALIGDVTRDGVDEPCVVRGGQLLCDTARNGGASELAIPFNLAGTPFLGDLDRDGRDDACVFGGGQLSCDTDRDGDADATLALAGSGVPLMGNVDGL
jgi:hypothetical protein